jgi:hypothetical protein
VTEFDRASISPGDVLAIVNYINAFGTGPVPANAAVGLPFGFLDTAGGVNGGGDNIVAPNDALGVINVINSGLGGEGESLVSQAPSCAAREVRPLSASAPLSINELIGFLAVDVAALPKRRLVTSLG